MRCGYGITATARSRRISTGQGGTFFHGKRHPAEMGAAEVGVFLTHLATERQASASTQNQAKAALLFLYGKVLGVDLPWLGEVVQAKVNKRLPVVLTPREVRALMDELNGTMGLIVSLLYGTGMRLLEGCGCG